MAILNALSMPYLEGTTNTAAAIANMRDAMFTNENGDRDDVPNVAVVMTDGRWLSKHLSRFCNFDPRYMTKAYCKKSCVN